MKKIIIFAIIACFFLSACNNDDADDEETTSKIQPLEIRTAESAPVFTSNDITYNTASSQSNVTVSESSSQTEAVSVQTEPISANENNNMPEWIETPTNGKFYVNTDNIYSRIKAIQGSEKIQKYRLNDVVTVVAKTDTDYYKLSEGTFIHADYLSENETVTTTEESSQTETAPPEVTQSENENENVSNNENNNENVDNTGEWTETTISGERYVNTDFIYSRNKAIQGSEKVKQYRINDKVTVTAETNTGYCKLSDGTFIHKDYLSRSEVIVISDNNSDYTSTTKNGYIIERIDGITYVDGIMIANKTYTLPRSYDPGIRQEAADALKEMQTAAAAEGLSLFVVSGYRSYDTQETVYAGWVNRDGVEQADTYSSRAGHSDHQTGYTFDLNSLDQSFADTQEGIWLAKHCAEFGFIIRYPEGKEMYTGYVYEPWHVRFVGKEKAKILTESGLSLEEFYGIESDYAVSE